MFKIYDEPESPHEEHDEPESSHDRACSRYMMDLDRQMRGRAEDGVFQIRDELQSPHEGRVQDI